jgi:hypothetical protein
MERLSEESLLIHSLAIAFANRHPFLIQFLPTVPRRSVILPSRSRIISGTWMTVEVLVAVGKPTT